MASKLALRYSYTYNNNSNTDASSDYDFELTAEEEDLLEDLVATASTKPPATIPELASLPGIRTQASTGSSSLRSDIAAAFATHPSVKSLDEESEIDFNIREVLKDPSLTYRYDPPSLPGVVAAGTTTSAIVVDDNGDDELTALVEEAERRLRQPDQVGDVKYPELSRVLDGEKPRLFETPKIQPPGNDNTGITSGQPAKVSPLIRFRNFPRKPFSVSDLTAGAWCELQYYYTLTKLPYGKKTRTPAMKSGTKVHMKLEAEIYTKVTIKITKKEDAFGMKIWNLIQGLRTLRDTGMTRELEVWGIVADDLVVNGVIDNLSYENPDPEFEEEVRSSQDSQEPSTDPPSDQKITTFFHSSSKPPNKQIFITDVKTRASSVIPSGAALRPTTIQLFLYHRFLSEMAAGRLDFFRILLRYALRPDEPFSDLFVAQIGSLHDEIFEDATDVSAEAASSSDPPSPTPDLIRYPTLRQLISLLETELRLTFPDGADSIGSVVNVEYRKRPAKRSASDGVDDEEEGGALLGTNVLFVDPDALDLYLQKDLEWWEGKRAPRGVAIEESYKCRTCEFADACEWRQKQDADILAAARKRSAARRFKSGAGFPTLG